MTQPSESKVTANQIEHHVLRWGHSGPTVVLCHGFLDIGWSFDSLAQRLVEHGFQAVSFDWRGHGESQWIGNGGYYHFVDYLLDLDELLPQLSDEPVHLVGHSMGATACSMYGGVRPERLRTLTLIEGLGPPEGDPTDAPGRARRWFDQVAHAREKTPRSMADTAEALARMRVRNPGLPDDFGLLLAEKATRAVGDGRQWSFDPLHLTRSPMQFRTDIYSAFLKSITVPTLLVLAEHGMRLPDGSEKDRANDIPNYRTIEIADVGHMVHWFKPDELAEALVAFFNEDH